MLAPRPTRRKTEREEDLDIITVLEKQISEKENQIKIIDLDIAALRGAVDSIDRKHNG